jgi:hypothetical protein
MAKNYRAGEEALNRIIAYCEAKRSEYLAREYRLEFGSTAYADKELGDAIEAGQATYGKLKGSEKTLANRIDRVVNEIAEESGT